MGSVLQLDIPDIVAPNISVADRIGKRHLVYIPSENFVKGRNILDIRKNYFSKDSIQKIVKIPFFYKKE